MSDTLKVDRVGLFGRRSAIQEQQDQSEDSCWKEHPPVAAVPRDSVSLLVHWKAEVDCLTSCCSQKTTENQREAKISRGDKQATGGLSQL